MFTRDFNRECKSGNTVLDCYKYEGTFGVDNHIEDAEPKDVRYWWGLESWWCEYSDGGV
jgi:hypothetical protein